MWKFLHYTGLLLAIAGCGTIAYLGFSYHLSEPELTQGEFAREHWPALAFAVVASMVGVVLHRDYE